MLEKWSALLLLQDVISETNMLLPIKNQSCLQLKNKAIWMWECFCVCANIKRKRERLLYELYRARSTVQMVHS